MSSFFIGFEEGRAPTLNTSSYIGKIVLGTHEEPFRSSSTFWTMASYQGHWQEALRRLLGGKKRAALITDVGEIQSSNFLVWWPMWAVGGRVHIQNHLLFFEDLSTPFELARYDEFIEDRKTVSEDLSSISEWTVSLKDIEHFVERAASNQSGSD